MKRIVIDRRNTHFFSELSCQINDNQATLNEFVRTPFHLEAFESQIQLKKKSFSKTQRELIAQVFTEQMAAFTHFEKVKENLALLKDENTFTVTSGHQLNLFGGPLYVIYKIMDAIRLAEKLKEKYNAYHFIPVFWLATEDHDFEEINHLYLFNEKIVWESKQKGAVGRFQLDGFEQFKTRIVEKFKNQPEFVDELEKKYTAENLAQASVRFLMEIAGEYGILILDADDRRLKASFSSIFEREILTQFSEKAIHETTKKLEDKGFFGQAFARPINLFYLNEQSRERIIPIENGQFEIGEKIVSKEQLLQDLQNFPERFSPNVVFRPLYQEYILPNLCYLGGGGEMAYWLQLKSMFETAGVIYPLIKVRNSVEWIDNSTFQKMEKLNLSIEDLFKPLHQVQKDFVLNDADGELDFSILNTAFHQYTTALEDTIIEVDKGLEGFSKSETAKLQKQIDGIQEKLIRHHKKKNETEMNQIENIFTRLFPQNGLQERFDNMLPFLSKYGAFAYTKMVYDLIDPFEKGLILVIED